MFGGAAASLIWKASIPHILAGIPTGGLAGTTLGSLTDRVIRFCGGLKPTICPTKTPQHAKQTPVPPRSQVIEQSPTQVKYTAAPASSDSSQSKKVVIIIPEKEALLPHKYPQYKPEQKPEKEEQ